MLEQLIKDLRRELTKSPESKTSSYHLGHTRFNNRLLAIIDKYELENSNAKRSK